MDLWRCFSLTNNFINFYSNPSGDFSNIISFLSGASLDNSNQKNHNLLLGLYGQQGFGCVQASDILDHKVIKKMYKIHFVPPALAWFKNPKPDPRFHHPSQQTPDLIGLWDPAIKRPTTDRHFTPSTPSSEDIRERFLTCPPSVCSDPALKALLESKPLTRSVSGK